MHLKVSHRHDSVTHINNVGIYDLTLRPVDLKINRSVLKGTWSRFLSKLFPCFNVYNASVTLKTFIIVNLKFKCQ